MGGWKLEVFRMAMYVSFPVGLFYLFNQPVFFEQWMMEKRAQIFPPDDPKLLKKIEEMRAKRELMQENELLEAQNKKM
ncbi:protein PET100 homolog, mitochondrial-like [Physella acuta]|uniref:protein PET100 homolog, mitochondrial-like n=1 Tax=Physella acuta TaxID=109671 RepID=UPI0027DBC0EA|nr:protein PET100 homolog, mitochondrial-like [Physella acuta]